MQVDFFRHFDLSFDINNYASARQTTQSALLQLIHDFGIVGLIIVVYYFRALISLLRFYRDSFFVKLLLITNLLSCLFLLYLPPLASIAPIFFTHKFVQSSNRMLHDEKT